MFAFIPTLSRSPCKYQHIYNLDLLLYMYFLIYPHIYILSYIIKDSTPLAKTATPSTSNHTHPQPPQVHGGGEANHDHDDPCLCERSTHAHSTSRHPWSNLIGPPTPPRSRTSRMGRTAKSDTGHFHLHSELQRPRRKRDCVSKRHSGWLPGVRAGCSSSDSR